MEVPRTPTVMMHHEQREANFLPAPQHRRAAHRCSLPNGQNAAAGWWSRSPPAVQLWSRTLGTAMSNNTLAKLVALTIALIAAIVWLGAERHVGCKVNCPHRYFSTTPLKREGVPRRIRMHPQKKGKKMVGRSAGLEERKREVQKQIADVERRLNLISSGQLAGTAQTKLVFRRNWI